jgi:enediyne biosynthesis protein E4
LGGATSAEVRVIWPNGAEGPWQNIVPNSFYILSPDAEPTPWTAPQP